MPTDPASPTDFGSLVRRIQEVDDRRPERPPRRTAIRTDRAPEPPFEFAAPKSKTMPRLLARRWL